MKKIKKKLPSIIVSIILYISILMLLINTIYNDNNTEWLESTTPLQHGMIFSAYTIFFWWTSYGLIFGIEEDVITPKVESNEVNGINLKKIGENAIKIDFKRPFSTQGLDIHFHSNGNFESIDNPPTSFETVLKKMLELPASRKTHSGEFCDPIVSIKPYSEGYFDIGIDKTGQYTAYALNSKQDIIFEDVIDREDIPLLLKIHWTNVGSLTEEYKEMKSYIRRKKKYNKTASDVELIERFRQKGRDFLLKISSNKENHIDLFRSLIDKLDQKITYDKIEDKKRELIKNRIEEEDVITPKVESNEVNGINMKKIRENAISIDFKRPFSTQGLDIYFESNGSFNTRDNPPTSFETLLKKMLELPAYSPLNGSCNPHIFIRPYNTDGFFGVSTDEAGQYTAHAYNVDGETISNEVIDREDIPLLLKIHWIDVGPLTEEYKEMKSYIQIKKKYNKSTSDDESIERFRQKSRDILSKIFTIDKLGQNISYDKIEDDKRELIKIEEGIKLKKIREILKISDKFRLDMLQDILKMEFSDFNQKLLEWATEFGFRIDGDYLITKNADIDGFIKNLDKQFELWNKHEKDQ